MNATVLPFETHLAEAKQRLEDARTRETLRDQWLRDDGVLRGYYLSGAVCQVELHAAHRDLKCVYESRLGIFDLQAEWRRQHRSETDTTEDA